MSSRWVSCPYNQTHKVKWSHLPAHKAKCPDAKHSKLVQCPFNFSHLVAKENLMKHKKECPDRVVIEESLLKEMKDYIQKEKSTKIVNQNEPPSANNTIHSDNKSNKVSKIKKENKEYNLSLNMNMNMNAINRENLFEINDDNLFICDYNDEDDLNICVESD